MAEGLFVCVCSRGPPRENGDWASYEPELDRQLRDVQPVGCSGRVILCQSAGVAVLDGGANRVVTLAQDGCVAAFLGVLHNARSIQQLLEERIDSSSAATTSGRDDVENGGSCQEAYLIYKLYKKLGPCMVSRLQGDFAFVLHDSHVGQVAAARSAGSSYQLLHGRTADGKLAIAGGAAAASTSNGVLGTNEQKGNLRIQGLKLPSSWQGLQEVPRGCYIYGQDGRVQQFEFVTEAGCSAEATQRFKADDQLLLNAMANTALTSNGDPAHSMDGSVGMKKTRRGKRAGRNLKDRTSFEGRRTSTDSRRISMEGRPSFDMPFAPINGRASTDSQRPSIDILHVVENSRADSDNWWRRSTDEGTAGADAEPEAHTGAGYSHCSARRTSSLPDTLSVAPPKDLTIPEHPGQVESGGDEAYIQRKAANAVQVHAQSAGFRQSSSGAGAPRRRFPPGSASPTSGAAAAAAAAAAALSLVPSARSCTESRGSSIDSGFRKSQEGPLACSSKPHHDGCDEPAAQACDPSGTSQAGTERSGGAPDLNGDMAMQKGKASVFSPFRTGRKHEQRVL
ncbi:hypothetical protein COCOBI_07-2460 [Coccomyxa sp. Obi]|nr:hypothetical protein COCOBI_07-2460 [Coccomyxa sp. Obi]